MYLSDMVSAEHPARVVDAVVENLDIRELERTYKGGGTSSYAPRVQTLNQPITSEQAAVLLPKIEAINAA